MHKEMRPTHRFRYMGRFTQIDRPTYTGQGQAGTQKDMLDCYQDCLPHKEMRRDTHRTIPMGRITSLDIQQCKNRHIYGESHTSRHRNTHRNSQ